MPLLDTEGYTPVEREAARTRVELGQIQKVLASPDWRVFLEHQAAVCTDLLERVLYPEKAEKQQEWISLLRANLELARDFGYRDLIVRDHLMNLERQIKGRRAEVRAQVAAAGGYDADSE